MSSATPNGQQRFRVSTSGNIASQLKQLVLEASQIGQAERFFNALRRIHEKLENQPSHFGEPLFFLKSLAMEMRLGSVSPIFVTYGVNYSARTVFISRIQLLP